MNESPLPPAPPSTPEFKDRRTGLKVFGVLEMICGVLVVLMTLLMLAGQAMATAVGQQAMSFRQMLLSVVFYAVVAVMLVWVGVGSFLIRRWGRALSLVLSWSWLVVGVLTWVFMIFFLPSMLKTPSPQGQTMPEAMRLGITVGALAVVGFIFILVPGAFVFFYQSRHVKLTCEVHDPVPRWTDSCPVPVLAVSLWLGYGALTLLLMPVSANGVLPMFGQLISGPLGWLGCLVLAGMLGYSAWAMYRLQRAGWWLAVAMICLASASAIITFNRVELMEIYRLMGYGEQQIEMMKQYTLMQGGGMAYMCAGGAVPMLVFLLFVRRYFRQQAGGTSLGQAVG